MSSTEIYMQAGVLTGVRSIEIQQRSIPEPGVGELRLKMKSVGICGSDVSIFQGHRPDLKFSADHWARGNRVRRETWRRGEFASTWRPCRD